MKEIVTFWYRNAISSFIIEIRNTNTGKIYPWKKCKDKPDKSKDRHEELKDR